MIEQVILHDILCRICPFLEKTRPILAIRCDYSVSCMIVSVVVIGVIDVAGVIVT